MSNSLSDETLKAQIIRAVQEELQGAGQSSGGPPPFELSADTLPKIERPSTSRVVVTAHGLNRKGIVAGLAVTIDACGGDIRDMSQTIVGGYFTILFVVQLEETDSQSANFDRFRVRLKEVGAELGTHVVVLHEDILASMHTV